MACRRHPGWQGAPAPKVRPASSVVYRPVGAEAILLDLDQGTYFGLNELGRAIWELLEHTCCLGEIHHLLLEQYEVPPDRLWHDLTTWANSLLQRGLLCRQDS